jgi:hypothetical protein
MSRQVRGGYQERRTLCSGMYRKAVRVPCSLHSRSKARIAPSARSVTRSSSRIGWQPRRTLPTLAAKVSSGGRGKRTGSQPCSSSVHQCSRAQGIFSATAGEIR